MKLSVAEELLHTYIYIYIHLHIMADVHNINNQNDPSQWFKTLPIVTQAWFGATMALTLSGNFGVVQTSYLYWSWHMIRNRLELWRILTCFCYAGPFEFNTLITICKLEFYICICIYISVFFYRNNKNSYIVRGIVVDS